MNALFSAATEIEAFCAARGWRCALIGGLAVQRWGEPRQTRDVDLTILTGLGGEDRVQDWLDVEGIIVRQNGVLDRHQVLAELRPLLELKEDDAAERRLLALFHKHQI